MDSLPEAAQLLVCLYDAIKRFFDIVQIELICFINRYVDMRCDK